MSEIIAELYVCDNCSHVELELDGECPECLAGNLICTDFVPAAESIAMRQLISEQMERIEQQQAVVGAARDVVLQRDGFGELHRMVVSRVALDRLAAALPQPATKDKP